MAATKHVGSRMQDYLKDVVYVGTASTSLTANLTRYLASAGATSVTNQYLALMVLAANS